MSVHDIARRAGADLRAEVGEELGRDLETGLAGVRWAHRRRRQRAGLASVAAAAALVGGVALLGPLRETSTLEPTGPDTPTPSPSSSVQACTSDSVVFCLGQREVLATMDGTNVHVRLPQAFVPQPEAGTRALTVDFYQSRGRAGVTLLPDVRAVGSPSDPVDAHTLATWISTRPFLEAGDVLPARIGGRPAWRVNARLLHNVPAGNFGCNGGQPQCWPVLETGATDWQTGMWTDMECSYYVLDGPGGHPIAVWAWAFDHIEEAQRLNDELVAGIRITAVPG